MSAENLVSMLEKAAKLSRIYITSSELESVKERAEKIFQAFAKLSEVDTENLEPLYTFKEAIELRSDKALESLNLGDLFSGAPASESNHFVVPRVGSGDDVL